MKDSGKRQDFSTGAVRDASEGKPMLSLLSPFMLVRVGLWLTAGALKYSARNWEKGMPFSRVTDSMFRHLLAWMEGRTDEDHLAAIITNATFLMHYQEMIKRGVLDASLNDMPDYSKPVPKDFGRLDTPQVHAGRTLNDLRVTAPALPAPRYFIPPPEKNVFYNLTQYLRLDGDGKRWWMSFDGRSYPGCDDPTWVECTESQALNRKKP